MDTNGYNMNSWAFSTTTNTQHYDAPPGPKGGILEALEAVGINWPGPAMAYGSMPDIKVRRESVKSGPFNIKLPWFLPYFDEQQTLSENTAMRLAYRKMLSDSNVKAAFLGKVLNVCALEAKVNPANKKDPQKAKHADFIRWWIEEGLEGGLPGFAWSVFSGGLIDGYSICEKVNQRVEHGKWAGAYYIRSFKPKDTGRDVVLETDEYRNIVSVKGIRYNAGESFHPANFVIYRHLPLFDVATGMSDLRSVYKDWWMLDTVKKLRAFALEKRSLPIMVAEVSNPSQQPSVEAALEQIRSQNWLCVPEGVRVTALSIAGSADSQFADAIRDLKHDIFLGIEGAVLQSLEGTTTDGRGNSSVHKSKTELFVWHLSTMLEHLCNDSVRGVVKDLIDLNFITDEYPRIKMSAVNERNMESELAITEGLWRIGVHQSLDAIYEQYGVTPPDAEQPMDSLGGKADQEAQVAAATLAAPGGVAGWAASDKVLRDATNARMHGDPGITGDIPGMPPGGPGSGGALPMAEDDPKGPKPPDSQPENPEQELPPTSDQPAAPASSFAPRYWTGYRAGNHPLQHEVHAKIAAYNPTAQDYDNDIQHIVDDLTDRYREQAYDHLLLSGHVPDFEEDDYEALEAVADDAYEVAREWANDEVSSISSKHYDQHVFKQLPTYFLNRDPDFTAIYQALKDDVTDPESQLAMNDWLEEHGLNRFKFYFDDDENHPRARPMAEDWNDHRGIDAPTHQGSSVDSRGRRYTMAAGRRVANPPRPVRGKSMVKHFADEPPQQPEPAPQPEPNPYPAEPPPRKPGKQYRGSKEPLPQEFFSLWDAGLTDDREHREMAHHALADWYEDRNENHRVDKELPLGRSVAGADDLRARSIAARRASMNHMEEELSRLGSELLGDDWGHLNLTLERNSYGYGPGAPTVELNENDPEEYALGALLHRFYGDDVDIRWIQGEQFVEDQVSILTAKPRKFADEPDPIHLQATNLVGTNPAPAPQPTAAPPKPQRPPRPPRPVPQPAMFPAQQTQQIPEVPPDPSLKWKQARRDNLSHVSAVAQKLGIMGQQSGDIDETHPDVATIARILQDKVSLAEWNNLLERNPTLNSHFGTAKKITPKQITQALKDIAAGHEREMETEHIQQQRLEYDAQTLPPAEPETIRSLTEHDLARAKFVPQEVQGVPTLNASLIGTVLINGKAAFYKGVGPSLGHLEEVMSNLSQIAGVATPTSRVGRVRGAPEAVAGRGGIISSLINGQEVMSILAGDDNSVDHELALSRWEPIERRMPRGEVDRAVLFAFLTGVEDRHLRNYMVANNRLVSIDHEFGLWENHHIPGGGGPGPLDVDIIKRNQLLQLRRQPVERTVFDLGVLREMVSKTREIARAVAPFSEQKARLVRLHGEALEKLLESGNTSLDNLDAITTEIRHREARTPHPGWGWWL